MKQTFYGSYLLYEYNQFTTNNISDTTGTVLTKEFTPMGTTDNTNYQLYVPYTGGKYDLLET